MWNKRKIYKDNYTKQHNYYRIVSSSLKQTYIIIFQIYIEKP